jgi:predicted Zn-dependent peptidase
MFQPQVNQLTTGLKMIRIPMPALKSVTCLVVVNVGSRYEQEQQQGLSHLIEHLVFKGTEKFPSSLQLATTIDSIGANCNAFTSKEYTGFYVTAAADQVELGLTMLQQLLLKPLLKPSALEQEKKVVLEELHMIHDSPSRYISDLFEQLVYQGSGLAHQIVGSESSLQQLSRQQVQGFMHAWYGLGNMTLVLAGDTNTVLAEELLPKVEAIFSQAPSQRQNHGKKELKSYFHDWSLPGEKGLFGQQSKESARQKLQEPARQKLEVTEQEPGQSEPQSQRLSVEYRQTAQAHFVLGWPTFKRLDPRRYALSVLSTVIGGNRSSRLFHEVRERLGLAYYIWSDVDQYHDIGILGAEGGVNADQVGAGIEATIGQFWQLAQGEKPAQPQEVQQAKDYLVGKTVLSLEDSLSVAKYFALKDVLLNKLEDPDQVLKRIQAVTTEQVNQLAAELVRANQLRLAVIGPFKDQDRFVKIMERY